MLNVKRILFPTDFSKFSEHALPYVVKLVSFFDAELHLLHAYKKGEAARDTKQEFDDLKQKISKLPGGKPKNGLVIKRQKGIAAGPVIFKYAQDHDIDIIVIATHGRRGIKRFFLGSVAEEVARFSPCPVLTVRDKPELRQALKCKRILVPLDFSAHSRAALQHAAELAKLLGSELHLLHVIDQSVITEMFATGRKSLLDLESDLEGKAKATLDEIVANLHPDAFSHVRSGNHVPTEIENVANEIGADLLVIASLGFSGRQQDGLGGITQTVLRQVKCPVFTLHCYGKCLTDA